MSRLWAGLVLLTLACLATTTASPSGRRLMEQARATPQGWTAVRRADPADEITLIFAIKQTNLKQLERTLLSVSDPRSASYGQHLSLQQVNALVAPRPESIAAVTNFLAASGVPADRVQILSDFVVCTVPVSVAESLLHAQYSVHELSTPGLTGRRRSQPATMLRCPEYSLPIEVARHVDFVGPTVRLPAPRKLTIRSRGPNDVFVTPEFLRALYKTGGAVGKANGNSQAVASFLEQYYSPKDLQEFFSLFQNSSVGRTPKDVGPNDPTNPGDEAELDVQYIMSVGEGVDTWVYYTPGRAPTNPANEPFLAWLVNVSAEASPPNVFSVSYGEDEKSVGYDYASRVNAEFMKLGARGVTVMVASGDDGAGGNCTTERFTPDFPSGSPWVTAVGGVTGGNVTHKPTGEITDLISGGGFSDWWPRPAYQDAAIANYLKNAPNLPAAANFNASGRGYPDVAAQSEFFTIVLDGIPLPGVSGTSCASPTFSGIVALLNDVRLQAGKSPLGFLNPLLYQIGGGAQQATAFNDITIGSNMGCVPIISPGFPAFKGWDAATGWGSPSYEVLSQIVAQLP